MRSAETGRPHTPYWLTVVVLAAGVASYGLLQSLVTPVLVSIQHLMHTTQNDVTWVLTAYLLAASVFTPILGRIGDMFGRKRVYVFSLLALATGCLLSALAPNLAVMVVGRVVQGLGGGVLPLSFGIVRDELPSERVSGVVGSIATVTAVGSGSGLVLAGPIEDALGTRWLFWLPMIVTALVAVVAHRFLPDSPVGTRERISWRPAVLLSLALVCLLLPLNKAPQWGWGSAGVLGLLAAAVVVGVLWVRSELRASTPLIDMVMMRRPAIWTTNLAALLVGVGMYASFGFLPEFLQMKPEIAHYGFGVSVSISGLIMLPLALGSFTGGQFCGPLARRYSAKAMVCLGCGLNACALAGLVVARDHIAEVVLWNAVEGVGLGLAFAALASLVVAAVPEDQTGVASGMNANIRTIGGSIGAAVVGSIVSAHMAAGGVPSEAGFSVGFLVLAGALLVAVLAGALIPVGRPAPLTAAELAQGELATLPGGVPTISKD